MATATRQTVLKNISIKNFKAFGGSSWTIIPIKPITIIFGKNSAGKSSLLHALLYIRDLFRRDDVNAVKLSKGYDFVDLGGAFNFLHEGINGTGDEDLAFKFDFEVCSDKFNFEFNQNLQRFFSRFQKYATRKLKPNKGTCKTLSEFLNTRAEDLKIDISQVIGKKTDEPLLFSLELSIKRQDILNQKSKFGRFSDIFPTAKLFLNNKEILFLKTIKSEEVQSKEEDKQSTKWDFFKRYLNRQKDTYKINDQILKDFQLSLKETFLNSRLFHVAENIKTPRSINEDKISEFILFLPVFFGPSSVNIRLIPDADPLNFLNKYRDEIFENFFDDNSTLSFANTIKILAQGCFLHLVEDLGDEARLALFRFFGGLEYLAAVRAYPERFLTEYGLAQKSSDDSFGLSSYATLFNDKSVLTKVSEALDQLGADFFFKIDDSAASTFGKSLKIINKILDQNNRIKDFSFKDIGFGWSQVVPVLIEVFSTSSALLVEQPELHLHPDAQSNLMQIIINNVKESKTKNQSSYPFYIFEAHSEQMVLKLLKNIRLKNIEQNDCAILYVSKKSDQEAAKCERLVPDNKGRLGDAWPGGFFKSATDDLL